MFILVVISPYCLLIISFERYLIIWFTFKSFFKISVDVSAHFPKMRIRFGGKAIQQAS